MVMPTIPKALYPLVPFAPGVPPLLRSGAAILDTATFGTLGIGSALDTILGTTSASKWGLFADDGSQVVFADSVVSVEYQNGSRVSNYPIEGGKFSSYNKVADPYNVILRMSCGGTESDRTDFLNGLETAARSLDLYTVVTPEIVYSNANVAAFEYRRDGATGANKIIADLHIIEVRQVAAAAFSNTQSDSAAAPSSVGQIQPVDDVTIDVSGFA